MPSGKVGEELVKMRQKAYRSPNIGKRGKSKKTIEREKFREYFEIYAQEHFDEMTKVDFAFAKKPKNWQARKDVREQLIGKPKERFEGDLVIKTDEDFERQLKKVYGGGDTEEKATGDSV